SSDLAGGEAGLPWPIFPVNEDGNLSIRRIGLTKELDAPPGSEDRPSEVPLTAVGPGDALFSAHYPACRGVLGFHDALEGVSNTRLSYLVTGWFSAASEDPLSLAAEAAKGQPEPWKSLKTWLGERSWTCDGKAEDALPRRIVCHGLVRGLIWKGED